MTSNPVPDEADLDKIAEDELARLQRQYRIMEMERAAMCNASKPKLRKQRHLLESLTREYEQLVLDLKVSTSVSNMRKDMTVSNEMNNLLLDQEEHQKEIALEKYQIGEMNFLLKQLEKEVLALKSQQVTEKEAMEQVSQNQHKITQLENRLEVAKKRFNTVNTSNFKLRQDIDHLLQERSNFNVVWNKTIESLSNGKSLMMELVEQSTVLYDQREEWCHKLQAIKERAQYDQIEHNHEMGELQRQLDHDSKLQQFLAVKGSLRVMAELEAKEAAKKRAQKDKILAQQERYREILQQIQEFCGENDVDKLIAQFVKQDEENYALFNYVNEVNQELESLANNVGGLRVRIEETRREKAEQEALEQETVDGLKKQLESVKLETEAAKNRSEESQKTLNGFMVSIQDLFSMMQCYSAPILQLLGLNTQVNIHNVMLFLKTIERKITDVVNCAYYAESVKKLEEKKTHLGKVTSGSSSVQVLSPPRSKASTTGTGTPGRGPRKTRSKTSFADKLA